MFFASYIILVHFLSILDVCIFCPTFICKNIQKYIKIQKYDINIKDKKPKPLDITVIWLILIFQIRSVTSLCYVADAIRSARISRKIFPEYLVHRSKLYQELKGTLTTVICSYVFLSYEF